MLRRKAPPSHLLHLCLAAIALAACTGEDTTLVSANSAETFGSAETATPSDSSTTTDSTTASDAPDSDTTSTTSTPDTATPPSDTSPASPQLPPVPCAVDADCPAGNCLASEHICAECLADTDCAPGRICQKGRCTAGVRCASDAGCKASAQVCSKASLACVDCNSAADCPKGLSCTWGRCTQACVSSKECPEVCHPTAKVCAQCGESSECGAGKACIDGGCQLAWCQTDQCVGSALLHCKDGRFAAAESCVDKNLCTIDTCVPGKGCWHDIAPPGGVEVQDDNADNDCDGFDDETVLCPPGDPAAPASVAFAEAVELCSAVSSTFPTLASPTAVMLGPNQWKVSSQVGNSMVALSTGHAQPPSTVNCCPPLGHWGKVAQLDIPGPCGVSGEVHDLSEWRLALQVPKGAKHLDFLLNFATQEDPSAKINDRLIILAESPQGAQNLAVMPGGECIGTATAAWLACPKCASGLYGVPYMLSKALTGWFKVSVPVQEGTPLTLRFLIMDDQNDKGSSEVFIDGFSWSALAIPAATSAWLKPDLATFVYAKNPPPAPIQVSPECKKDCEYTGNCTWLGGKCAPTSDAECKQSANCGYAGFCKHLNGACVVGAPADCQASYVCTYSAKCTLVNGACAFVSDTDCLYSYGCEDGGKCKKSGKACVALSNDDCYFAKICTQFGACTAMNGLCCTSAGKCY